MNKPQKPSAQAAAVKRLPCRGCTTACTNYAACDGKPWRQAQPSKQ